MHAVASDEEEIRKTVYILPDVRETIVRAKVRGICLVHSQHGTVKHLGFIDNVDLGQLLCAERDQLVSLTLRKSAKTRSTFVLQLPTPFRLWSPPVLSLEEFD